MHIHPLTSDVFFSGQKSNRIIRCPAGSTAPDAGKLFDRTKAYVDLNLGAGVTI